ncbi:aldehyde dehydrogenase family protein [Paraburkholderia pallida]|uniref:Aldehyde dehydrogenase family protein n=1 Tax=Paraburkholderia pallida TaxID=2547399 RepID=A0A4P7DA55_9BURK|nr:aldehyde dehydrogenase family protein [Paraburkholderia pallida]QBR04130.1 aldehyde dehydrogenase family protein [Paraburkholderia pallida]
MSNEIIEGYLLIDGELVESESGKWATAINPANEAVIGRAADGSRADVARAVDAASRAWPAWAERTGEERGEILRKFGDRLAERAEEISRIEVLDSGNTYKPTLMSIHDTVRSLRYYAGLAHSIKGETIPSTNRHLHMTVLEPYGVVGRIAAFNHPAMFSAARTASALVAGNTVVVKPPETSPLSVLMMGEIAREVFPRGVFNIVNGSGTEVGDALVRHPDVKRLALIGSVSTGRVIQRSAAEVAVKHVTLELGGKNPMIVFPDVDLDAVAESAVQGMNFTWQGQSCGSNSRLLIHEEIYEAVLAKVVERVAAIRLGDPMSPDTGMGPINSRRSLDHVLSFFDPAETAGARLMKGGKRPAGAQFERGFWVEPTVYADVTPGMRLWRDEVFGPILSVSKWRSVDEAVALANDTDYGLSAAIWTRDINHALNTAKRLRAGSIFINGSNTHFLGVPWGGFKNSGIDREEGVEELYSYLETKVINVLL